MNKVKRRMSGIEWLLLAAYFVILFFLSTRQEYNYAPDEHMRFVIPQYIFEHNALPDGYNMELNNNPWGFSYAVYPCFLGPILSAAFMKIVSVFTMDAFALVIAARFTSVIAGVLSVYFVMKLAKLRFPGTKRWILVALVAFLPQFIFLSTYVNNDIIAVLGTIIIFYAWSLGLEEKWNYKNCAILASGIIICALSYYNSYMWVLSSIILFFFSMLFIEKRKISDKELWKLGIFICIFVLLFISYFFIRNAILYDGDIFGIGIRDVLSEKYGSSDLKPSLRNTPRNLGMSLGEMLRDTQYMGITWFTSTSRSFIACFGYMQYWMPEWFYTIVFGLYIVGAVGVVVAAWKFVTKRHTVDEWKKAGILHVNLVLCMLVTVGLTLYYSYATDYQPQGRYCYPMMIILMYYIALGLGKLTDMIPKEAVQKIVVGTLTAGLLFMAGYSYIVIYLPS